MVAKRRKTNQSPPAPKANIAAMSTALTATFRRSSICKFNFSLLRSLCGGLLHCFGIVLARVGVSSDYSKDHERHNHAAAQTCWFRMLHTDKANGFFSLCERHLMWVSSDSWNGVGYKLSFNLIDDDGTNVMDVCV